MRFAKTLLILAPLLFGLRWSTPLYAAKTCTKGKPCGNTCIAVSKTCHLGTGGGAGCDGCDGPSCGGDEPPTIVRDSTPRLDKTPVDVRLPDQWQPPPDITRLHDIAVDFSPPRDMVTSADLRSDVGRDIARDVVADVADGAGDGSNGKVIAQLVRAASSLDADEQYLRTFLQGTSYTLVEYGAQDVSAGKLATANLIYMRTTMEPTSYKAVAAAIRTALQSGVGLVVENRGIYLLEYMGLASVVQESWGPVVKSQYYFVKPSTSHALTNSLPTWDPPSLPNQPAMLIDETVKLGSYTTVYAVPNTSATVVQLHFWWLSESPGWPNQRTDSAYCLSHAGLCTSTRSVHETAIPPSQRHMGAPLSVFTVGQGTAVVFHQAVAVDGVQPKAMAETIRRRIIDYAAN